MWYVWTKNWLSIHSGSKPVSAGVLPECKYKLREPEVFYRGAIFVKISSIDQAGIWKEVNKDEKHGWRCYREQKSWIYPVKTLWKQKISTKLSTRLNTSIRRSYLLVTLQHVFDVWTSFKHKERLTGMCIKKDWWSRIFGICHTWLKTMGYWQT